MRATVAILLAALALSCAGQKSTTQIYRENDERKNEISALWMQIRDWRAEAGLPGVEAPQPMIELLRDKTVREAANVCEPPPEPASECGDICSIAEHICENAEQICRIAGKLPNDAWAREKCDSAKGSCKEAKQRCCNCQDEHSEAE